MPIETPSVTRPARSPRTRRRRAAAIVIAIGTLSSLGCLKQASEAQPASDGAAEWPASLLAVEPTRLPEVVRARYRLAPDRRFLAAASEIARWGAPGEVPTSAHFETGRWRIRSGDHELGDLAELPGFEAATELLVRQVRRLHPRAEGAAERGAVEADGRLLARLAAAVEELDPAAILAVHAELEASVPVDRLDESTIRGLVSSLAWLTTLSLDATEDSDPLLATAWAWLAVERAHGIRGNEASEALLIRALGYESEAIDAAAGLTRDDPVRSYVGGDVDALGRSCASGAGSAAACFLKLALLAERGQVERFRAAERDLRGGEIAALARVALTERVGHPDVGRGVGRMRAMAAHYEALACASGKRGGTDYGAVAVEALSRELEEAARSCSERYRRTRIGAAAVAAAYRGAFYSGLRREASHALDYLASGPAALELAARIADPAEGTASDLRRWLEAAGAIAGGARDVLPLVDLLESRPRLDGDLLGEAAEILARHSETTDPLRRRPMPAVFERLDSRPAHREVAARIARSNLTSVGLHQGYARSAVAAAPHLVGELAGLVAQLDEEAATLRAIVDDPAMPSYAQVVALAALAELGRADDAFVRSRYEAMAADPDEGISPLLRFLEERGDVSGAHAAVMAAIERGGFRDGLAWAYLRGEAARLKLELGDTEGAWRLLRPAIHSGKEDVLLLAARVQLARSELESAVDLSSASLGRYPDRASEASSLLASARWRQGDHAVAARELAASTNGVVAPWNRHLPEAFAETFAAAPSSETELAFEEMITAGIAPHVLASVAIAFGRRGELETALRLIDRLPPVAPEWTVKVRFDVYDLIREREGEKAAAAWFRAKHQRSHQDALTLYQLRRYDALLELFPIGDEGGKPNVVRVVQAAALLHLHEREGARWEALVRSIESDRGSEFFSRAGRYLVGRADATELLSSIPDVGHLASIGWAMGVRAASEGRFEEADGWLQVALESGQRQQPPHAWAWQIESDWIVAKRSMARLEAAGEF